MACYFLDTVSQVMPYNSLRRSFMTRISYLLLCVTAHASANWQSLFSIESHLLPLGFLFKCIIFSLLSKLARIGDIC